MEKKAEKPQVNEEAKKDNPTEKKPHEIDFKEFFTNILIPFTPPRIVLDSIKVLLPGDTTASDFEEIIDNFPGDRWAGHAGERLKELKP